MKASLLLVQTLNGLQFGVLLFLLAAILALPLTFGLSLAVKVMALWPGAQTPGVYRQSGLDNLCGSRGTIRRTKNSGVGRLCLLVDEQ
jgi:hypothetical protein